MESEIWKEIRKEQQNRRRLRLPKRTQEILSLRDKGHTVKKLTAFQYRINNYLDVFPIHNRYHNIRINKRGGYKNITEFIQKVEHTKAR